MKFTCEKRDLVNAITYTSGAVALKNSIASLEGIFIRADDELALTGYNLEIGIISLVEANIIEEGEIILNAKLFGDIVRKLPDDVVTVTTDETLMTTITCGISQFKIMGVSADDYPELPTVKDDHIFNIPQNALYSCISQTVYAVSDSETRPVHTGCKFILTPGKLTMAAVDSFRLAIRNQEVENDGEYSYVVPGTSLKEVQKILTDTDELCSVIQGRHHIMFKIGNNTLISRVLEGEFLDYERVIPQDADKKIVISRSSFSACVERVALVISEKYKTHIRCVFDLNKATMAAATAVGSSHDEVFTAGDGKGLIIGFNSRYMLEALKNAPSSELLLEMSDSGRPIVIKAADPEDDSFLFMVMPVRLSN